MDSIRQQLASVGMQASLIASLVMARDTQLRELLMGLLRRSLGRPELQRHQVRLVVVHMRRAFYGAAAPHGSPAPQPSRGDAPPPATLGVPAWCLPLLSCSHDHRVSPAKQHAARAAGYHFPIESTSQGLLAGA
ncbi:hypothetical protein HaLaN_02704 [Haematococcus lacustris]|uniref:Uncharacterized protein n=1 Tax=Haematococcus lacustris TaxID=44745 RepID=A0A699YCU1_HAELA|nr:hypothetical protein HaLaN_02704 [Haematococcus lacustris]